MPRSILTTAVAIAVLLPAPLFAQQPVESHGGSHAVSAGPSDETLIRSALAAAPKHIADGATVIAPGPSGAMRTLRTGKNGFTCMPDAPNTPGPDPMCLDEQAMIWAKDWMAKAPKPTNTAPGIMYMLRGGSDISATDPFATATKNFVASPPHWMIVWPFDGKATGLPLTPKKTGTWIMWPGTPYAHLMINQVP
jgi:hypothetical protein